MGHALDEPFGDRVADLRAGVVAAAVLNTNRDPDTEPVGALDFFSWHKAPPPPEPELLPPEVLAERIRNLLNSKAGKDK